MLAGVEQFLELLHRLVLQSGNVHLRDVEPLGDLSLREVLEETVVDDRLLARLQRVYRLP